MDHYYLNKNAQPTHNEHELHKEGCSYLPDVTSREYIGYFQTESEALKETKRKHTNWIIDGCYHCCPSIHKI